MKNNNEFKFIWSVIICSFKYYFFNFVIFFIEKYLNYIGTVLYYNLKKNI